MSSFTKYLGSYERRSPLFTERIRKLQRGRPEDLESEKRYQQSFAAMTKVTASNYPLLNEVINEECAFRKIERPDCYMDHSLGKASSLLTGGQAHPDSYTIFMQPDFCEMLNKAELRWLVAHEIKHLYQGRSKYMMANNHTPADGRYNSEMARYRILESEHDSDRAGIESAGYEAYEGICHKSALYLAQKLSQPEVFSSLIESRIAKTVNHLDWKLGLLMPHKLLAIVSDVLSMNPLKPGEVDLFETNVPNYEAVQPYVSKAVAAVVKVIPLAFIRDKVTQALENNPQLTAKIAEKFSIQPEPYHPSPAARLSECRLHASRIENKAVESQSAATHR